MARGGGSCSGSVTAAPRFSLRSSSSSGGGGGVSQHAAAPCRATHTAPLSSAALSCAAFRASMESPSGASWPDAGSPESTSADSISVAITDSGAVSSSIESTAAISLPGGQPASDPSPDSNPHSASDPSLDPGVYYVDGSDHESSAVQSGHDSVDFRRLAPSLTRHNQRRSTCLTARPSPASKLHTHISFTPHTPPHGIPLHPSLRSPLSIPRARSPFQRILSPIRSPLRSHPIPPKPIRSHSLHRRSNPSRTGSSTSSSDLPQFGSDVPIFGHDGCSSYQHFR